MSAKLIQVIETESLRGRGVPGDVTRMVKQYYTVDGMLLAEVDPCHVMTYKEPEGDDSCD